MAEAVALAKLHGTARVSWALGHAAVYGRFAERDLPAILAHQAAATPGRCPPRQRGLHPAGRHRHLGRVRAMTAKPTSPGQAVMA